MATSISTQNLNKHLHIVAIQTAPPGKLTEPGQCRRISVTAPLNHEALQSRLRIVLYYKKANEDDTAGAMAAWMRESLSDMLTDHPVLAGRLRRESESDGYWEIKLNDAGARMIQASAELTMSEFLSLEDRDGKEELLAPWVDVDVECPVISALFYVQVTEFQGGDYSIGISCSLLLADPIFLSKFLNKWAIAHSHKVAGVHSQKKPIFPIFHLSNYMKNGRSPPLKSIPLDYSSTNPPTSTTVNILSEVLSAPSIQPISAKTQRLEAMTVSEFILITYDNSGQLKVDFCQKKEVDWSSMVSNGASDVAWGEGGGPHEVAFIEGKKPVHASCHFVSAGHEGVVVVMPSCEHDGVSGRMLIATTLPKSK